MSIWGEPFEDEFVDALTHNQRGILSMANGGPNTNKVSFHTSMNALVFFLFKNDLNICLFLKILISV